MELKTTNEEIEKIRQSIKWKPRKQGGASFKTHKLVKLAEHRLEFKPTAGALAFYLFFTLVGIAIIVFFLYRLNDFKVEDNEEYILLGVGVLFFVMGLLMLLFGIRPIVFDWEQNYFWKGRKDPRQIYRPEMNKNMVRLDHIIAIQLIKELVRSKNSRYHSYELNLILKDYRRVNVVDFASERIIEEDARILAERLQVPVLRNY